MLQYCADSDDDAEAEAGFECDFDPDEPVMEGSDDEFSISCTIAYPFDEY